MVALSGSGGRASTPGGAKDDDDEFHSGGTAAAARHVCDRQDATDRVAPAAARRTRADDARPRSRLRRGDQGRPRQVPLRGRPHRDELRRERSELCAQAPATLAQAQARADAADGAARPQLHLARAQGRRADHRALELPVVDGLRTARRRHRRRQLRGHEAVRSHDAHFGGDRAHPAALPRQRRFRGHRGRRAGDHGAARKPVRPHPLHRQRARGTHRDDCRSEAPDAGDAGTGRQEPLHHRQERRPGRRRLAHRLGQVHQRGPDLRRAGPRPRPPFRGDAVRGPARGQDQGFLRRGSAPEPGLLPHRQRAARRALRQAARRAEDPHRRRRRRAEPLRFADDRARPGPGLRS